VCDIEPLELQVEVMEGVGGVQCTSAESLEEFNQVLIASGKYWFGWERSE
jgi:hypothetical protein